MASREKPPDTGRTVQSVDTAFDIIEALVELDGAGVTELADHLGLSKGAVHTHLATLEGNDYVRGDDGVYRIGLRFFNVGQYARRQIGFLEVAKREVDTLSESTGYRTQLTVEEHGFGHVLHISAGDGAIEADNPIGSRGHLHCTAVGKAILAHLPEERAEEIVDRRGLPARTDRTITDREALREELARIRERGVAHNDEESMPGLRAVGAPIKDADGDVLGAISVSGPLSGMDNETFYEEIPAKLANATDVIRINNQIEQ